MRKLKNLLFIAFVLSGFYAVAQPGMVIHNIDSAHNACLTKGEHVENCALVYRLKLDSMVKVVYNILRIRYDTNGRVKLRNEQEAWENQKELYKSTVTIDDKDLDDEDKKMDMDDKMAGFDRKRIMVLLDRMMYLCNC